MDRRLEGHLALDYILAAASGALVVTWNGETEHVAWVAQKEEGDDAIVGFMKRAGAIERLQALAEQATHAEVASQMRSYAEDLAAGPTDKVQCVVHGWGGIAMVSLEPDDLRAAPHIGASPVFVDFGKLIDTVSNREGAAASLAEARAGLAEPVAELDRLVELVFDRWDDIAAIAIATAKASHAIAPQLSSKGGQRAREILNALAQATSDRGSGGRYQNARGGSA